MFIKGNMIHTMGSNGGSSIMDVISFMLQIPLNGAAENGHIAVVEVLLKAGADVNKVSHFLSDLLPLWS